MHRFFAASLLVLALLIVTPCLADPAAPQPVDPPEPVARENAKKAELEKRFAELMSDSKLVGHFTMSNKPVDGKLSEETYEISKVTRLRGPDMWQFFVRIKYGKFDVKVPLSLQVKWAGDTPMITLTDFTIPAMGTFSARVLIYDNRYAGTWQHGKVGGHLFGKVIKKQAVDDADDAAEVKDDKAAK